MFPRAKKSYSQNWLVDESVLETIISAARIKPGENVLEIGPGTGVLTQALVDAGAYVTAIEADPDLITNLRKRFGDRIVLIHGDALSFPPPPNPPFPTNLSHLPTSPPPHLTTYSLISNIPYNLTSDILRHFLTTQPKPSRMILMLQREVADRITAKPGDMSLLSVVCQLYARCEKIANVPRGAFRPVPKVDSAIVRMEIFKEGSDQERENIIRTAKAGFSSPRKQLHGNLARALAIPSERVKQTLVDLGLDPKTRAESLDTAQWTALTHKLNESG
jgi:16S rRNA (adenine1518-N6/adenine1519-N6)-dimethyltransferase